MATKTRVMVNGLSTDPLRGKMARLAVQYLQTLPDFEVHGKALSGVNSGSEVTIGNQTIKLYNPAQRPRFAAEHGFEGKGGIVLDCSKDHAVYGNGVLYVQNGWNFVMVATGGDITGLQTIVKASKVNALFAPNLAAEIVMLEKVVEDFSIQFEGKLQNCSLRVIESHQATKSDPSGTAVKFSKHYHKMGVQNCPFNGEDIKAHSERYKGIFDMIRNPQEQLRMGVPEKYLGGHGWHTYLITDLGITKAHSGLYHALRDFMSKSPVFASYSKEEHDSAKEGCSIIRKSQDGNARFGIELRFDPDSTTPVLQIVKRHDVNGRDIYLRGVTPPLRFMMARSEGEHGKVFSTIDAYASN